MFDYLTNTGNIVDYLLNKNEGHKETYRMIHLLCRALKEVNVGRFKTLLNQARSLTLPKGLKRVLRSLNKWKSAIRNTCLHPTLTNGPLESINNKIKVLKRTAYDYRNYSHFRNRILLISRLYVSGRNEKETKQLNVA